MKRIVLLLAAASLVLALGAAPAGAQDRSPAWQIAAAVLPLPDSMRARAAVLGYRAGKLVELRSAPPRSERFGRRS